MGGRRTTRCIGVFAAAALLASTIGLIAGPAAQAATVTGTITSSGPLTKIAVSGDLNCSVNHTGDSKGEFFTDTACGTFVAVDNTTYGPSNVPGGPRDPGTSNYKKFTSLSQTAVSGAGTVANPFKVVTTVNVGGTGLRLTQTDSYVAGQESYRTDVALTNTGPSSVNAIVYRAGDCFLGNDDSGFGGVDTSTGAVACVNAVTNLLQKVPGSRSLQWYPITAGSRYTQDRDTTVWNQILARQPLPNTCGQCATYQDNGSGLSWSLTLAPNQSTTRSNLLTFAPVVTGQPLVASVTADAASVAPASATGYTVKVTNPNSFGVTLTSITDDLAPGFSYRMGTSTGPTTADPVATNNGLHLTWSGSMAVPASGSVSLHFGATAPTQPGDYFNRAGGTAAGTGTVTASGDTAKVTVVGPATLGIAADRGTVTANPSNIATTEIPLQRSAPRVQSAGIISLPLLSSPIVSLPLLSSGIISLPLLSSPILALPLLSSGIISLPLLSSPFGIDSLGNPADLGSSPAVRAGLARISLASLAIISGPSWSERLAGTSLADRPLYALTLGDVLAANLPVASVPSIAQLDLSASPLGSLSSVSLFLGDTRLKSIGGTAFGWCGKLEALGHPDCGANLGVQGSPDKGLSASLLSLEISGVNPDAIPGLRTVLLKDVTFPAAGEAALPAVLLSSFDLSSSSVGGILVKTVPSGVVDCTKIDCSSSSTKNLDDASRAGALPGNTTIGALGAAAGNLTIQEAVIGTYPGDAYNPYAIAPENMGVLGYSGAGASQVKYHASFVNQYPLTHPAIAVTLPAQFRYVPGTASVKLDGTAVSGVGEPATDGEKLTWNLGNLTIAPGRNLTVDFTAAPGLRTGLVNASIVVTGDAFTLNAATDAPLAVVENYETGDQPSNVAPVTPGRLEFAHLGHAGDVDYYSIPAPQPGSHINVFMNCSTCDADVTLYHPSSAKPHNPMRPAAATPEVRPEQDQDLGLASNGEPLQPLALDDMPLLDLPVAGISANREVASEAVHAVAWDAPAGAQYLIQVSSYNGSTSVDPYTLRVSVTSPIGAPPAGAARSFPHDGDATYDTPAVPASFAGVKTLVITNRTRLRRAFGDARAQVALDAFNQLASDASLGVQVLFTDAFPEINALLTQLDALPSDPERSNDVIRAINARVDSLLGPARAGLRHIVLGGGDEINPFGRIPDLTSTANERDFSQELRPLAASTGGNNALLGAAWGGNILTDDPYCSFAPQPFLGTFLYVPDVACGRLVETPEDMAKVIGQFFTPSQSGDGPGILRPSKSLSAGADFMTTLADSIKTTLNNEVTPGQVATLISNSWKRSDIQAAFPGASPPPDIAAINAHYRPDALRPGDASEGLFTTAAFGGDTPPDIARRIVLTMGCHSGFSISNLLAGSGTSDWADAMLGRGVAAFVGSTGYGIGLRSTVAFSAKVIDDFTRNMARMPLGTALAQAKRTYLGGNQPNVYDYKVMAEKVFFGLPMFKIAGAGDTPPAPPAPRPTSIDPATGLTVMDIAAINPADNRWELINNGEGSYYALSNRQFTVAPNRPIQPRVDFDVNLPGYEARGSALTALQSVDSSNTFNPALARAVVGQGASETEVQFGSTIFPTALQSVGSNTVSLTLAQFQSGPNGTTSGVERRFTKVGARVFLVPVGTPRGNPTFSSVSANKNGATTSFRAVVADPAGGTVRQVAVVYNDGTSNDWIYRQLALGADGSWVGGFPANADRLQYFAEAVTDRGDVARTTNKGDNFDFASRPAGSADIDAAVAPAESNGWYPDGAAVTLTAPAGTTFSVTDNGGTASTWSSGQAIPVHGSGLHVLHYVAAPGGETGDVTVQIDDTLPAISGAPTTAANAAGWYNGPVTVHFTCADAHSGVATCEPDRTLPSDGTNQSVTGQAIDNVGNRSTATVSGINIDTAPPTIGGVATTAPNANGWYKGPVTVHFTCADDRSGVVTCPADQTLTGSGANQSVTGTAIDAAGNSTSYTVSASIDLDAPTITATPNDTSWRKGPVTVHFTCADALSGVATCPADVVVSAAGTTTVNGTTTDRAGNSATVSVTVRIDNTTPTSNFNSSGTIIVLPGGPINGTAADNASGIATVMVTFRNSSNGSTQTKVATVSCAEPKTSCAWTVSAPAAIGFFTATAVATDRAGNTQTPGTARTVQVIA